MAAGRATFGTGGQQGRVLLGGAGAPPDLAIAWGDFWTARVLRQTWQWRAAGCWRGCAAQCTQAWDPVCCWL